MHIMSECLNRYGHKPRGIVHAGAHHAEEMDEYLALQPDIIVWIEGDPLRIPRLREIVASRKNRTTRQLVLEALITDRDDTEVEFYRFSNQGMSSSIFHGTPLLASTWPELRETGETENLQTCRLDTILAVHGISPDQIDCLFFRLQGAELLALKGSGGFLDAAKFIGVELSHSAIYQGGALAEDIEEFLDSHKCERISALYEHCDAVYRRRLLSGDLIDRFAARWGANAALMRSPPSTHFDYTITGGAGRDHELYNGEIEAIRLSMNGRWGNYVYQLINLFHVAETIRARYVVIAGTEMFRVPGIVINNITISSHSSPIGSDLYCITGVFFSLAPLGDKLSTIAPERCAYLVNTYIRPLLIPLTPPRDIIGRGDLVIHIRSGDIFQGEEGDGGAYPGGPAYIQPPLNFYLMAVSRAFRAEKGNIFVISENALNPVVLPLVEALDRAGHAVTLRLNQDLAMDLAWLFAGHQVIFANGSIGIAIALLSESIQVGYFLRHNGTGTLRPVWDYIGDKIESFYAVDQDQRYIQMGHWKNTKDQRSEMVEFPIVQLKWDDPYAPHSAVAREKHTMLTKWLINVALNRPALQSSMSTWSKPDDPRRAVSGLRTGSFAFCTAVESEPYWSVDLQSAFLVRRIAIFNREDSDSDRICPLIIETSVTGEEWCEISTVRYVFGGTKTGTPLDLYLKEPIRARYLRLRRTGEPRHFHLDQVEIYTGIDDIESSSQLGQDLWVLQMTGGRSGGSFVEIGSTDGVNINNTFLLETRFAWRGVCVEPNPAFYQHLERNRTVKTFQRAVFRESGNRLEFVPHGELGTLIGFESSDLHASNRETFMSKAQTIKVETISPNDLFEQGNLPALIDFLSLDTEGSEWDILQSINFSRYKFALMAIEHNFVADKREMIYNKLKKLGYYRFNAAFDDWFYHPAYLNAVNGGVKVDFNAVLSDYKMKHGYGKDPA